jgi:hypothetical protein
MEAGRPQEIRTTIEMKHVPQQVSESVRRLNPHLYPLGKMEARKPKPSAAPALERRVSRSKTSKRGVGLAVSFCAHRKVLLDDDNNVASIKPLRDAVSAHLGVDDGDPSIRFQYTQIATCGTEGVSVTIERIL